jgi:hypothetical protein
VFTACNSLHPKDAAFASSASSSELSFAAAAGMHRPQFGAAKKRVKTSVSWSWRTAALVTNVELP